MSRGLSRKEDEPKSRLLGSGRKQGHNKPSRAAWVRLNEHVYMNVELACHNPTLDCTLGERYPYDYFVEMEKWQAFLAIRQAGVYSGRSCSVFSVSRSSASSSLSVHR